jgi:prophage regulatory protein
MTNTPVQHRLLRRRQVEQILGLSRSTIYAKLNHKSTQFDRDFPRPIALGSMSVAWLEDEIQRYIAKRAASRTIVESPSA